MTRPSDRTRLTGNSGAFFLAGGLSARGLDVRSTRVARGRRGEVARRGAEIDLPVLINGGDEWSRGVAPRACIHKVTRVIRGEFAHRERST